MQLQFPYYILDLTHPLGRDTPTWNGSCGFREEIKMDYSSSSDEVSFRVQSLKMHAGIGTHMDAPSHAIEGGMNIDELELENLVAPCVVIDVSTHADENYTLALEEVKASEASHGMIPPHSFVMVRTGWEKHWEHPKKYRNHHRFPAVSKEVAQYLIEKQVVGLGIDTLSPDRPDSHFPVHEALLGTGKYIVENAANLKSLPLRGSFVMVLPIKAKGCTEAPARLFGLIPK